MVKIDGRRFPIFSFEIAWDLCLGGIEFHMKVYKIVVLSETTGDSALLSLNMSSLQVEILSTFSYYLPYDGITHGY